MWKVPERLIYTMKGLKKMLSEISSKSSLPVILWFFNRRVVFRTSLQIGWIFPFKLKFWAGSHLLCIRQLKLPAPAVRMIGWKMIHPTLFLVSSVSKEGYESLSQDVRKDRCCGLSAVFNRPCRLPFNQMHYLKHILLGSHSIHRWARTAQNTVIMCLTENVQTRYSI